MATQNEIDRLTLRWSMVIQQYMETEHSARLDTVPPKGELTSVATLLANWEQAIPNTYAAPNETQLLAALAVVEAGIASQNAIDAVEAGATAQAAAIPNFATWTEAEMLAWSEANIGDTPIDSITNLAEAQALMKKQAVAFNALIRFTAAFRNKLFPNLEGS
jgi:hypothetical protein